MSQLINQHNRLIKNSHENIIEIMSTLSGISGEGDEQSLLTLYLYDINNLPYDSTIVKESIELALTLIEEFSFHDICQQFSKIYLEYSKNLVNELEAESAIVNNEEDINYQFSTFCTHPLPQTKTEQTIQTTEYPNNKLTVTSAKGLPYGGVARMIILYINSIAVKYRTREITLGKSIRHFVENLGYAPTYTPNGMNNQVLDQLEKLFHTTYINSKVIKQELENGDISVKTQETRFHLFDGKITWELITSTLNDKSTATVVLSERYFEEIIKHPVPLSLDALKLLKKSPLAMDLYALLAYRVNTGGNIVIPYNILHKQFAIKGKLSDFKMDLKRANEYLIKVWPNCKIYFKPQVMFVPKTEPPVKKRLN